MRLRRKRKTTIYRSGQKTKKVRGIFQVVDRKSGKKAGGEVVVAGGKKFPPARRKGLGFKLAVAPKPAKPKKKTKEKTKRFGFGRRRKGK